MVAVGAVVGVAVRVVW